VDKGFVRVSWTGFVRFRGRTWRFGESGFFAMQLIASILAA
jgi:hypothetical protein